MFSVCFANRLIFSQFSRHVDRIRLKRTTCLEFYHSPLIFKSKNTDSSNKRVSKPFSNTCLCKKKTAKRKVIKFKIHQCSRDHVIRSCVKTVTFQKCHTTNKIIRDRHVSLLGGFCFHYNFSLFSTNTLVFNLKLGPFGFGQVQERGSL